MLHDGYLPKLGYEHPDLNDNPRPDPFAQADLDLAKRIGAVVDLHYLGQPFFIKVCHDQGMVQIKLPALMPRNSWYAVPIRYLAADPGMKCIINACGYLLERYNIPRSNFDRDHYLAALTAIPVGRRQHGHLPG